MGICAPILRASSSACGASSGGLEGTGFHLALMLIAGAAASVAALVAMRAVAGDGPARAAAPFVAIAPVLVWRTNPDIVFGAIALVGVALAVVAVTRDDRRGDLLAVLGGFVFSMGLFVSYGVAILALIVLVVASIGGLGGSSRWSVSVASSGCWCRWCGASGGWPGCRRPSASTG